MKRIALLITPLTIMTLVACNNGRSYNPDTQINFPQATQPADPAPASPTGPQPQAGTNPQGVNVMPMNPQANTAAKPGVALNPAHGQPGHRCEIAVGAPLDSKPAASTTPVTTTTTPVPATTTTVPQPVTVNPQPAAQKVAPGMNPAHGQPGHRCDIAVGAPLNSKPAAATTPAQQVTPLQPQPLQVTPVMPATNPVPAKTDSTKNK